METKHNTEDLSAWISIIVKDIRRRWDLVFRSVANQPLYNIFVTSVFLVYPNSYNRIPCCFN